MGQYQIESIIAVILICDMASISSAIEKLCLIEVRDTS